jgi:prepilin-type N-terminal cleavage/methylation domain-containing protein
MGTVTRIRSDRGFTLVEMMMSVMLIGIVASMAVLQIASSRPALMADGAMRSVVAQLNYAREFAVSQRREVRVEWNTATNILRLVQLPNPGETELVTLREVTFESGVKYGLYPGAPDTPDGFGNSSAVDFDAPTVMFTTDGTLVDSSRAPVNGTIFLRIPEMGSTGRAVTVMGSVGRVRGYRWNGTIWTRN